MEDNIKSVSTDLFYKVRSRFSGLKLGTETGEVTINPEEAVFFDFDYMEGQTPVGHVSISLAEPGNMKVYYSTGIAEDMDPVQKDTWYDFLRGLREFAKRRLMSFDTRDITKDNLDQRDFGFLSQYATTTPVGEGIMKEGIGMYGTAKTSYQKLENTRLIIKHNQQVDETSPGARTRHINAMFIENGQGERFKYPFIHLAGARAMQRHVQEGGLPYDDIGKHIIGISEKIAHLKNFGNYVVRNDLMNSETNEIVGRAHETLDSLRETIKKLAKRSHYEQFKSEFQAENLSEVPQDFIEDLTNKFTVKNFKEDIKGVFPIIYSLMQANEEIHYDDIVAMTHSTNEDVEIDLETTDEFVDPFSKFESWAMNLGEDNAITSQDEEEKASAVEKLQTLVGQHFPAGMDGQNAIESLKGIIDDPRLAQEIKATAKEDADTCVRPLVYQWLENNAPDVVGQLDFGDMDMSAQEAVQEGFGSLEEEVAQILKKFDEDMNEIGGYGDPDQAKIVELLKQGDWDGATEVVWYAYADQDGGELRDMDNYIEDIEDQFKDLAQGGDEDEGGETDDSYALASAGHGSDEDYESIETEADREMTNTPRDKFISRMSPSVDNDALLQKVGKVVNSPEFDSDTILKIVDAGSTITHPVGRYIQKEFDELQYDLGRQYEDYPERVAEKLLSMLIARTKQDASEGVEPQQQMNIKEVAEFMFSCYDKESRTFPRGPEGVVTMVGKKFGEQAEHVARQFVERMAPQQNTQVPQVNELARIRELSGLQ